ncbi:MULTISPECIES: hypothetical protein [Cupriavidus]|uniref:hypothetical protein n=1 Tax=Cupriavidus TaxID=106589 RepID=UPI001428C0EF|nr:MULTISPECIES: hypothetical protein [Cupriavidus]
MRYVKAIAILLVCILLAGLLSRQWPHLSPILVMVGVAAGFALAAREVRRE